MRDLSERDVVSIHGGKSVLSKAINVIGGSLITGLVEGFAGFMVAGPVGFAVGFGHGAFEGAAGVLIYEGAMGLTETLHPELGIDRS
jgi:hypothetical protein